MRSARTRARPVFVPRGRSVGVCLGRLQTWKSFNYTFTAQSQVGRDGCKWDVRKR